MEWTQTYDSLASAIAGEEGNVEEAKALIPDIVRLVEDPDVTKELAFDEISMQLADDQSNDPTVQSNKRDIGGIAYPIIRINDYVFPSKSVRYMNLSCSGFLPMRSSRRTLQEN